MATNPALKEAYPLSTRDGDAIPLDIVDPIALQIVGMTAGLGSGTILANYELGHVYSTEGCIIEFGTALIPFPPVAVVSQNTLLVPPGVLITARFPVGIFRVISLGVGTAPVYIQYIRKWAALGMKQQLANIGRN